LTAYPNPFSSNLNLALKTKTACKTAIEIYNLKGQLVNTISVLTKSGENVITWNGKDEQDNNTPAGIYLVRISGEGKTHTVKCIKLEK
jgi:flagellar hook assembly protein FlgD